MPEFSLSAIRSLLQQKGADRLEIAIDPRTGAKTAQSVDQRGQAGTNQSPTTTLTTFGRRDFEAEAVRMRQPYGGSLGGDARVGFVLTSDIWRKEPGGGRAITLHAGPQEVTWTLPMRASEEENKAGHARYAQPRYAGTHGGSPTRTFYDLPRVEFTFQTGNILPIPLVLDEVQIPYGLDDFYLFLELLNQPPLVDQGDDEGKHNYVWIFYTSLQFPQVVLKGYFDPAGVSWTDVAEQPTSFTWSASFVVHEMTPNLWERDELRSAYTAFMSDNIKLY